MRERGREDFQAGEAQGNKDEYKMDGTDSS